jgi:hypothetical protein
MINSVFSEYFQKSRIFLYPLLGIKRGVSVTPIKTFVSWQGKYKPEDRKLVCLYHLRNDAEYVKFEQSVLYKNELFEDFKEIDGGMGVYVFDFSKHAEDWDKFLAGRYSRLSPGTKSRIKAYLGTKFDNRAEVESYLHPERFFTLYAKILYDTEDFHKGLRILRRVGELCDKPNLMKETLVAEIRDLQITSGELSK